MICPVCGSDAGRILETRTAAGGKVDRRRHECACGIRWTSRAVVEPGSVVNVSGAKTDATGSVMHERRDATRSVSLVSQSAASDTRDTLRVASGPQAPPPTGSVHPLPVACGGVGGGLSGDRSIPGSVSDRKSDPNPIASLLSDPRARASSNAGAVEQPVSPERRRWDPEEWFEAFRMAWIAYHDVGSYGGQPTDYRAVGDMREILRGLSQGDALAAQRRAQSMFAEFFAAGDEKAAAARHPWAWFVMRFNGLRLPRKPASQGSTPACGYAPVTEAKDYTAGAELFAKG